MAFKSPDQIAVAAVAAGEKKAHLSVGKLLVGGFLAGAYIGIAGLLAVDVSAGMDRAIWGGAITLVTGAVFSLGLILVLIAGSELLTGNMALVPMALMRRKTTWGRLARNWGLVLAGNLVGSLFVAYFLAVQTGVIGGPGAEDGTTAAATFERLSSIASGKALAESNLEVFLRAVGCNWLVCLAVWMSLAAEDIAGKILAIFFPITAFVALGFDHVVANMFFLPAAYWAGTPGLGWGDILTNWLFAGLGNAIGGAVLVGVAYWFLYLRGTPQDAPKAAGGSDDSATAGAPRGSGRDAP
ncbi:formate/nitrite transporter family protein [Paenibacillus sp. TRM 82003]|uniref:formate/nitrite transporter family protein n=1 Tax=Kineococcus sp. TRM81007 TaxID=2925831 RepID=UPI001F58A5F7|nr:formate/nitrite transporter family protein [Kineococcus sp. TRM81007]MCI2240647.1 formate/nitrite transporter family protein [Kineococcus sp. TRM81007]MCI3925430.1 formate/nitrite transporter family protein [Paenibacillus sp. TRM 82003]